MRTRSSSILAMIRQSPTRYFQKLPNLWPFNASPMLRGSSSGASRSLRNAVMRRATWRPSRASSLAPASASSVRHAKVAFHRGQRHGGGVPGADFVEPALRQVQILQVGEVHDDGLLEIRLLAAPRRLRQ